MRARTFTAYCLVLGLVALGRLGAQGTPAGNTSDVPAIRQAGPGTTPAAGAGVNSYSSSAPAAAAVAYDKEPLPKDPAAALLLASKANGLGGEGLKPWYLKAHYQAFDARGKPAAKGVFELYWEGPEHYRVSYAEDGFSQATYHTPEANYEVGSAQPLPYADSLIWQQVMYPVQVWPKAPVPESHERKTGATRLNCDDTATGVYCFDIDKPVLRAAEESGFTSIYNRILLFQHRFSAGEISVREEQQQILMLEIDTLREMQPTDLQTLVPPSDARKIEKIKNTQPAASASTVTLASGVMAGSVISKASPIYPAEAKARHVQGHVLIAVTIGKDGLVHNPVVVHDPDMLLSQAALDAVSKWRYQPYLLDGVPVEVHTVIRVDFYLGG